MRHVSVLLATCLFLGGCEEMGYVEKSKYDVSQEQSKQAQVDLHKAQDDLKKAQQQIADYQAHKYQIYTNGGRTWRLDSVTGKTCVLLTTDEDWKNPKITESGCQCEDAMNDQSTYEVLSAMGCFGKREKNN
jgi:hypothetical protein